MSPGEAREVVAELHQEDAAIISITGDVRREDGVVLAREAGVHRHGEVGGHTPEGFPTSRAMVRWYETVTEWFARSAA